MIETLNRNDWNEPPDSLEKVARIIQLVIEWASQHKKELMVNWKKARNEKPLNKIEPLQ
jgi:hypothetical protein